MTKDPLLKYELERNERFFEETGTMTEGQAYSFLQAKAEIEKRGYAVVKEGTVPPWFEELSINYLGLGEPPKLYRKVAE